MFAFILTLFDSQLSPVVISISLFVIADSLFLVFSSGNSRLFKGEFVHVGIDLGLGDAILTFSSRRFDFILSFFDSSLSPIVTNGDTNRSLLGVFRDVFYHVIQRSDPNHYEIGSRHLNLGGFIRHSSHYLELDLTFIITNGDTNLSLLDVFCDAFYHVFQRSDLHHREVVSRQLKLGGFIQRFSHHDEGFFLVKLTKLILKSHSLVFFPSLLAVAPSFPIPAATALWPASWSFGVYHHPIAATPSSCNNLMKPKFDRLIPFLGVSLNFSYCSCRSHRRAHPQVFGVFIRTLRTPPAPPQLTM